MKAFGLNKTDDGKKLYKIWKEDEIFFMTSSYYVALDYAEIMKGDVY